MSESLRPACVLYHGAYLIASIIRTASSARIAQIYDARLAIVWDVPRPVLTPAQINQIMVQGADKIFLAQRNDKWSVETRANISPRAVKAAALRNNVQGLPAILLPGETLGLIN